MQLFQRCAGGLERRWMLCRCTTPNVRARGGPRAPLLCLLKSVGEPPSLARCRYQPLRCAGGG